MERELRQLAEIRSEREPIVSVYLNTRWADEQQRERVRVFVANKLRWARAQGLGDALEKTLQRVETFVEGLCKQAYDESADGVAIFASEGLGLWKVLAFAHPFRNEFAIADTPRLLQFAKMLDTYQPVVVAVVDARGALIFEAAVGSLQAELQIRNPTHQRHSKGGWSQLRYQRHIDQQIERNHKEAAEHVAFLLEREQRARLVIVGPDPVTSSFERTLPPMASERILAKLSNPKMRRYREGEVRDTVLEEAIERMLEYEQELREENIHQVVGEALAGGLAVLGPQDVVLAANEERIHRLLLEEGREDPGWRCHRCQAVGIDGAISCSYCGGEVSTVQLGEELARKVIESGGEVQILGPQPLMEHYHGVAALLRHRGAVGQIELGSESPVPNF